MAEPRREPMTDDELAALVDSQIADARAYARSDLAPERERALEYVRGEVDIPAEKGRSQVTSNDLRDVMNWIMPGLLRVFLSGDRVGLYEPRKAEFDEEGNDLGKKRAEQSTDYANAVFLSECDGYRVLQSAFYDGLLLGNGLIKHWWDPTPEYSFHELTGLSDDQLTFLDEALRREDAEIVAHRAYPSDATDTGGQAPTSDPVGSAPLGGPSQPDAGGPFPPPSVGGLGPVAQQPPSDASGGGADGAFPPVGVRLPAANASLLHDVKIRRRTAKGRLRVEALPPEQFLIERQAKCLDENVRFCCHVYQATRSRLVEMGFNPEDVDDLETSDNARDFDASRQARDESWLSSRQTDGPDHSTELVDVFECYVLCDADGDGVAERRKVVMAGGTGERNILSDEEWPDDLPFSDVVPDPVPHRWRGHSLYEELRDIVRVKTVLQRQTLDNLYHTNNPMQQVLDGSVLNMDVLVNRTLGGNIFVKQPGAVTPIEVPFTAAQSFQMLEYFDRVVERRGFSTGSGGLDPMTLQNQTATAASIAQAVAFQRPEFYARNMAEVGLRRLFKCILKLICRHQDRPRTMRLRGAWVEMDPTSWDPEMDVSVNTGLGSGSRDRDLAMLVGVKQSQELVLQTLGPDNPLVDLVNYRNTLAKSVEVAGLRSPEQFFKELTEKDVQAWMQQKAQAATQQPDPKMQEAQARMQIEQAKAEHDVQMSQAKAAAEFQHKREEASARLAHDQEVAAAKMQMERDRAAADINREAQKHALEMQLMREKAVQEAQLKREELALEAQLKREQMAIQVRQAQATNIEEASPQ